MGILNKYLKSSRTQVSMESDVEEEAEKVEVDEALQLDDSETPENGGSPLETFRRSVREETPAEEESTDEESEEDKSEEDEGAGEDGDDTESSDDETESEDDGESNEEESEDNDDSGEDTSDDEESEEASDEDKEEAAVELESLKEKVLATVNKGGLSEELNEATVVASSVKLILSKVGMHNQRVVPSLESFSESSSRRMLATKTVIDQLDYLINELRS